MIRFSLVVVMDVPTDLLRSVRPFDTLHRVQLDVLIIATPSIIHQDPDQ